MDKDSFEDVAQTFFSALEKGDLATVRNSFADDATIWHNFDEITLTPDENATSVKDQFFAHFPVRQYQKVLRTPLPKGILQQHHLYLERVDGRSYAWPGCVILEIKDRKITKLEEYVDLSSFMTAMS